MECRLQLGRWEVGRLQPSFTTFVPSANLSQVASNPRIPQTGLVVKQMGTQCAGTGPMVTAAPG